MTVAPPRPIRLLSTRKVLHPARAASIAAYMPAPPDPMIRTSVSTCMGSLTRHGIHPLVRAANPRPGIKPHARALTSRIQPGANTMPDKRTIEKAREDKREGKSVMTQAGEFVKE